MDGLPIWYDTVDALRVSQTASLGWDVLPVQRYSTSRLKVLFATCLGFAVAGAFLVPDLSVNHPGSSITIGDASIPSLTSTEDLSIPAVATLAVGAQPEFHGVEDSTSGAAPASVTIFYDQNEPSKIVAARVLASRLQKGGVFVRQVAAKGLAGSSLNYVFEQDRQTALSLAVELGGLAGPVRQVRTRAMDMVPGTILISLQ